MLPYDPYVDPEHPEATNTVNCFEQLCEFEEEWRRYWGRRYSGHSGKTRLFAMPGHRCHLGHAFDGKRQGVFNRGSDQTMALPTRLDLAPGSYHGLLTQTSTANQGNSLTVSPEGQATVYLGRLSALVVWSQPPQP